MSTNNQCEKMENLKIRVKNRDQVLAVHGLAKCLGMVKPYNNFTLHDGYVALDFNDMHILDASIEQCGSELNPFKEITLPELRQLAGRESLNDQYAEIEKVRHAHYFKDVSDIDEIDVYEVLHRFGVTDPCLQHIAKKALCAGERGHKDFNTDLKNIADTAQRMLEIHGL